MADAWPDIPYEEGRDTLATLHMWTQVVGKVKLELCPFLNEWWQVAFSLTPWGLTTGVIPFGDQAFAVDFDFLTHRLTARTSTGSAFDHSLRPQTVAAFYEEFMDGLRELGIDCRINTMPSEVTDGIPFEKDTVHGSYDANFVERFSRVLLSVGMVIEEYRQTFAGKSSPVNFYWGGFDLSETRFNGKATHLPETADLMYRVAEDQENFAVGFWPGGEGFREPVLYAYMLPSPDEVENVPIHPAEARFEKALGEWIYPWRDARTSSHPAHNIRSFLDTAYESLADAAGWDRQRFEVQPPPHRGRK